MLVLSCLFILSLLLRLSVSYSDPLLLPTYEQLVGRIEVRLVQDYRCRDRLGSVSGRVEVFLHGKWGTICRNRLSRDTGDLLCREMGYSHSQFSNDKFCSRAGYDVPMLLSYIECHGSETSFKDCILREEKPSFCRDYYGYYHGRDLALTCYKYNHYQPVSLPVRLYLPEIRSRGLPENEIPDRPENEIPDLPENEIPDIPENEIPDLPENEIPDRPENEIPDLPENEIPSLQSSCSGVVVITFEGTEGFVSSVGVDSIVGSIVCEQSGYYKYLGPLPSEYLVDFHDPILLAKPYCTGSESELRECSHWGWGPFPHLNEYDVFSVQCECEAKFECGELEHSAIRLRSKVKPWEGRLEVKVDDEWGSVCNHGFLRESAIVACRQLGFAGLVSYTSRDVRNAGYGPIKLRDVACKGNEEKLTDCKYTVITSPRDYYCRSHFSDIMLRCKAEPPEPKVRLIEPVSIPGGNRFGGSCMLLEFKHGEEWFPHCCEDKPGIQYNLATVCKEAAGQYLSNSGCTAPRSDITLSSQGNYSCNEGSCYTDGCNSQEFTISENCPSRQYTYVCCSTVLPDLVPNIDVLLTSLGGIQNSRYTRSYYTMYKRCAVEDGCLAPEADPDNRYDRRNLLTFSTQSDNLGSDHFRPPVSSDQWEYHQCHRHYHSMEHFVDYSLKSYDGSLKVGEGHKASFCLEDSGCYTGGVATHRCGSGRHGNQGISPNCYDLYSQHLDCQWIDVTSTPFGEYRLELDMNPSKYVPESDFSNNKITCIIDFFGYYFRTISCDYEYVSTPGHS